ncbi:site-specific integrase, partial [Thomasclavelia cocleata]
MNLDKLAGQYLEYLQYQRHYSIKTIESYNRQIKHFIYFL